MEMCIMAGSLLHKTFHESMYDVKIKQKKSSEYALKHPYAHGKSVLLSPFNFVPLKKSLWNTHVHLLFATIINK